MLGRHILRRFSKKLAYVHGGGTTPLISETIGSMLRKQAAANPSNPFQVFYQHDVEYTYEEFDQRIDEIAKGFISLGIQPGDRVGIYSPNRPEWALTQYACHRADIILVNVNPAFQTVDLEYAINLVGIKAMVMPEGFSQSNYVDIVRKLIGDHAHHTDTEIKSDIVPTLERVLVAGHKKHKGFMQFDDLYKLGSGSDAQELARREEEADYEAGANIQFTSGTTGFPKGALLSHHGILNNGGLVGERMKYNQDSKLCIAVPLYHTMGLCMASMAMLYHGGTAVFPCEGFKPDLNLKAIEKYKWDSFIGVPTMYNGIIKEYKDNKDKYDISSLKKGNIAGSICSEELVKACTDILGIEFFSNAYGMTETSPISFQIKDTDSLEHQTTTIGQVSDHVEAKIAGPDGKTLNRGEEGEICVRGYHVMLKYWNNPEKTAETIDENGWLHSGDVGVIDRDGYCDIIGRDKDIIIRGGENIFPKEVEGFLITHPNVLDVQVIGVDDDYMGEEVMACVLLDDPNTILTKTDVYEFMHGNVAHFKIPKYVQIVDEYPLTVTGKVKKNVMRDEANKILKEVNPDDWEVDHNIYV